MAERARVADGGKVSVSVSQMSEPAGSPDAQVPQRARPRPKVGCWHVAEAMGAGKVRQPPLAVARTLLMIVAGGGISGPASRADPTSRTSAGDSFCRLPAGLTVRAGTADPHTACLERRPRCIPRLARSVSSDWSADRALADPSTGWVQLPQEKGGQAGKAGLGSVHILEQLHPMCASCARAGPTTGQTRPYPSYPRSARGPCSCHGARRGIVPSGRARCYLANRPSFRRTDPGRIRHPLAGCNCHGRPQVAVPHAAPSPRRGCSRHRGGGHGL